MEAGSRAGFVGKIPVRNLWLLMLYASDLFRSLGPGHVGIEEAPDEIPDLVAEILAQAVETRQRRRLTFGTRATEAELTRVRGRIDHLATERRQLLARGLVACQFDDLTVDTPRNRYVRGALDVLARTVRRPELARRCRLLASGFREMGVSGMTPTRAEMSAEQLGRNDAADRQMLDAARLAFELALPSEDAGDRRLLRPDRDEWWARRLFEAAVGGFYRAVLPSAGWRVSTGKRLEWQASDMTSGMQHILPNMQTDIVLDHPGEARRLVIDTKFTTITVATPYRDTIRNGYLFQIYAYLRSQAGRGHSLADQASGLLLHPSVDGQVDEAVTIQGHRIRFATVDLTATHREIRRRLLACVEPASRSAEEVTGRLGGAGEAIRSL